MISDIISAILSNYMTSLFVLGLIIGGIQVARLSTPRTVGSVTGVLLNAFIFWAIGISEIYNFIMHSVFGDFAAKSIGWAQSPFQFELALASLSIGVMAVIVSGRSANLRSKVGIVVAMAIFGYGAAGGHIFQLVVNNDHSVNNTGLLLAMDIIIPTVGIALLVWHAITRRSAGNTTDAVTLTAAEKELVSA